MDVNDVHYILMRAVFLGTAHMKVVEHLVAATDQLAGRPTAEYIQPKHLHFVLENSVIVTTNILADTFIQSDFGVNSDAGH